VKLEKTVWSGPLARARWRPPFLYDGHLLCVRNQLEVNMLRWSLIFLVVAIVAALLGFGGIAGSAMDIARILFFVFLVLFLISLLIGLISGRRPPTGPVV
jgi:uncharacterized membrane protein YtjA (UPF0391 family)